MLSSGKVSSVLLEQPSGPLKAESIIFMFPVSAKREEGSVVLIHLPFKCVLARHLLHLLSPTVF